jgi:hypothetical protein
VIDQVQDVSANEPVYGPDRSWAQAAPSFRQGQQATVDALEAVLKDVLRLADGCEEVAPAATMAESQNKDTATIPGLGVAPTTSTSQPERPTGPVGSGPGHRS